MVKQGRNTCRDKRYVHTFKAVEAGMFSLLVTFSLFWYVKVPRYVQSVWYVLHINLIKLEAV